MALSRTPRAKIGSTMPDQGVSPFMDIGCLGMLSLAYMTVTPFQSRDCSGSACLHWHRRSQLLILVFFGMMMGGFLTAQHLYLWAQQLETADSSTEPATAMQVGPPCIILLR